MELKRSAWTTSIGKKQVILRRLAAHLSSSTRPKKKCPLQILSFTSLFNSQSTDIPYYPPKSRCSSHHHIIKISSNSRWARSKICHMHHIYGIIEDTTRLLRWSPSKPSENLWSEVAGKARFDNMKYTDFRRAVQALSCTSGFEAVPTGFAAPRSSFSWGQWQ